MKKGIALLMTVVILLSLTACGKSLLVMNDRDTDVLFELSAYNHEYKRVFSYPEGKSVLFIVDKTKGSFSYSLTDTESGEVLYRANDAEAGTFSVIVPHDGKYQLQIEAKHATGSLSISK